MTFQVQSVRNRLKYIMNIRWLISFAVTYEVRHFSITELFNKYLNNLFSEACDGPIQWSRKGEIR